MWGRPSATEAHEPCRNENRRASPRCAISRPSWSVHKCPYAGHDRTAPDSSCGPAEVERIIGDPQAIKAHRPRTGGAWAPSNLRCRDFD